MKAVNCERDLLLYDKQQLLLQLEILILCCEQVNEQKEANQAVSKQ